MDINSTNWQALFFDFLIGGIVLFAIFRILRYFLPVFLKDNKRLIRIINFLPLIETIGWLLFFSWFTFRFFEIRSLYSLVIIAILLIFIFWLSRYFLKDLFAGMIFRTSGRFKQGDIIELKKIKGTIKHFKFNTLEIESYEGRIIYIPYSKLIDAITTKSESKEQTTAAFTFLLESSIPDDTDILIQNIRNFIITLPWSSIYKNPLVIVREQSESEILLEITIYPVDKSYAKKIESLTRNKFQQHIDGQQDDHD